MQDDSFFWDSGSRFSTTPWTDIISAKGMTREERSKRLSPLAERYWRPVYFFVRRKGWSIEDAKDLTQSFFVMVFDTDLVSRADPEKGKFRSYLLTALSRFLSKEYEKERRTITALPRETLYVARIEDEPLPETKSSTPQEDFDREWARTVINNALGRLEEFCERKDEQVAFKVFTRRLLSGQSSYGANQTLATELNVNVGEVENAFRKCIRWYRDLFRQEVRTCVGSSSEVEEEIRGLWELIG